MSNSEKVMSQSVVMTTASTVDLRPTSIPQEWTFSGQPRAWNKELTSSYDRLSQIIVWECTAGEFEWHYGKDESVIVISGEAFLVKPDGQEIRFAAGDVGLFPAGTVCRWRVPGPFRKVAVMREPMWRPFAYLTKIWSRFLGMTGFTRKPAPILINDQALSEAMHQVG